MLEVSALSAGYGGAAVLKDLDLSVGAGECVCLIGSNGAGKTTLMRSLSGLLRPVSGRIALEDRDIARLSPDDILAAGIALVPEGRRVFAPLTVRENLELGAYRRLKAGGRAGVAETFEFVYALFPRLKQRGSQAAGTLSGGEQQMLAIARALMGKPRLLLLDEPSMGLAPLVVKEIFDAIRRLNQEGLTLFFAEQNARMALRVASRGYVLSEGRIVTAAGTQSLMNDPSVREAYLGV